MEMPHHERIQDAVFRRAVDLLDAGDVQGLQAHLQEFPELARQRVTFEGGGYFAEPTLLEFIAGNPMRQGRLPANIVEVAKAILAAGVDRASLTAALELVATGSVPRGCGVQLPLIELLCHEGAEPDGALRAAALHGEHQAVTALLGLGAKLDLPVAAALGRMDDFRHLLPMADAADRHLALAAAAQFGYIEAVRAMLDAGEDPNRYNPRGAHAHSTPLHQAVWGGHTGVVRLLAERGARLDLKDEIWDGTPADWAEYGGRLELAEYLRAQAIDPPTSAR